MKPKLLAALILAAASQALFAQPSWGELRQAGLTAYATGNYRTAEAELRRSLQTISIGKADDRSFSLLAFDLAAVYQTTGRYPQAESLLKQALDCAERASGVDAPETAVALYRIASVMSDEGKYEEAATMALRSLAIFEKAHASSGDATALLRTLGNIRAAELRFEEAREFHRRALRIDQTASSRDVEKDFVALAHDEHRLGRPLEAEQMLKQAIALNKSAAARDTVAYAVELNNFGQLQVALSHRKEAEKAYREAIEIWRSQLGERHPFVALGLSNLADLEAAGGRWKSAENLYSEALAIDRDALAADSPQVARDRNNLATAYFHRNRLVQAELLLKDSLQVSSKQGIAAAAESALETANLAQIYARRKEFDKSAALYSQAVPVLQRSSGSERLSLAPILEEYAGVLRAKHCFADAERIEVDASRVRVKNALHPPE